MTLRERERARHIRYLKAPQIFPMVGDGAFARYALRAKPQRDNLDQVCFHAPTSLADAMRKRPELVEARYMDWERSFDCCDHAGSGDRACPDSSGEDRG